jgi:hypothetical protein
MSTETPLVWTSKGNLPITDLEYRTEWRDDANNTTFIETYIYAGEIVKQSVHVMAKKAVVAEALAAQLT